MINIKKILRRGLIDPVFLTLQVGRLCPSVRSNCDRLCSEGLTADGVQIFIALPPGGATWFSRLVTRNREIPRDWSASRSFANDFCRVAPAIT